MSNAPSPIKAVPSIPVINFADARGTYIGKQVLKSGIASYEPETVAAAIALVDHYGVSVFADIGANIGLYSLVLKSIFRDKISVHAFEPVPHLHAVMQKLANSNGLVVHTHEVAISDYDGEADFYISAQTDTSNSLNSRFRPAKDTITVQVRTFDAVVAEHGIAPRFVKIDTESTEPAVLDGARGFIDQHRPWIICEVLAGRTEARLNSIVEELGYIRYHLAGQPLVPATEIVGDATYEHRDWLFAPTHLPNRLSEKYEGLVAAFKLGTK